MDNFNCKYVLFGNVLIGLLIT